MIQLYIFTCSNFLLLSIERHESDLKNIYNLTSIRDTIKFIITTYGDLSQSDQYNMFLELSKYKLSKQEFNQQRKVIFDGLKNKFKNENARMLYHVTHGMNDTHLNVIDALTKEFNYYFQKWEDEKNKPIPNDDNLKMFSDLMHDSADLLGRYLMGTPVMAFIQYKLRLADNKGTGQNTASITDLNDLNKYQTLPNNNTSSEPDSTDQQNQSGGSHRDNNGVSKSNKTEHIQPSDTVEHNTQGTSGIQRSKSGRAETDLF